MHLVVTGANGFVGQWVVRRAATAGHRVTAVVRPGRPSPVVAGPVARAEVGEDDAWSPLLRQVRPDAVIHLAWPVPPRTYRHDAANLDGLALAGTVFRAAAEAGVPHVVGVGTCLELGRTTAVRCEGDAPAPDGLYATTKDAARRLGTQILADAGATFTWARLFHLHGPGEARGRLVREALEAFRAGRTFRTTPGEQVRDWMHVADAADALLLLAERRAGGIAHVCGGSVAPLHRHLRDLARLCGTSDLLQVGGRPYGIDEDMSVLGHPGTLQRLGFQARLSPHAALHHTVDAFRSGRWATGGTALPAPRTPVGLDHGGVRRAA